MSHYEFISNDTVGAHIRTHKSAEPKVGAPAILTIKGEEVPLTVRFCQDIKRTDKDAPREVSVWCFIIKKSGDGKTLTKHRGEKATLDIGTVAAAKAVAKRLEELKPANKAPKASKTEGETTEAPKKATGKHAPVSAEQKKTKKARTKAKHEALAK